MKNNFPNLILFILFFNCYKTFSQLQGEEKLINKQVYQGTFIVNGDKDKYYPVIFKHAYQNRINHLKLYRSYGETGPSEFNTPHKAGLLLEIETNYGGWGGIKYDWKITNLRQSYRETFGGAQHAMHYKGFIVFLRGGGFKYHYESEYPSNIQIALANEIIYDHTEERYDVYAPTPLNEPNDTNIKQHHKVFKTIYEIDGNIGIGTTDTKGFKLGVDGRIAATEVKVATYTNWPDYVLSKEYQLPTLQEVEQYINKEGHLQNIPSAKEVKNNGGIELGEMNRKLLEKIEELTLYTIQQQKEIEELKKENRLLKKLEERINKLENKN